MPLRQVERQVQLLEIHELSLKAAVSTSSGGGDILSRLTRLQSDFATLQAQNDQFQADFATLAADVRDLATATEEVVVLRDQVSAMKSDIGQIRAASKKAAERSDGLEEQLEGLDQEAARLADNLDQFARDHPMAAIVFELAEDCFGKQTAGGEDANSLMLEHMARSEARASVSDGRTSQNSQPTSLVSREDCVKDGGYFSIPVPEGEHTLGDLQKRGETDHSTVGAIRVAPGFEAFVFEFPNFRGKTVYLEAGNHDLQKMGVRVGAIRLQRHRRSEWAIRADVEHLQSKVDQHEARFADLKTDLVDTFKSQGGEQEQAFLQSNQELERKMARLQDLTQRFHDEIQDLRQNKADKGANMDLPEQLSDLTRRLHALQEDVTIESKRIDGKADYAVVDDKVTRAEIEDFVDAIQRLLNIGGPYAYTNQPMSVLGNFGAGSAEQKLQENRGKSRKSLAQSAPLAGKTRKVWPSLPRQYGGTDAIFLDHSSTGLGRGLYPRSKATNA